MQYFSMQRILSGLDKVIEITGKMTSYTILILIGIVMYEVFLRSLFNRPTVWVHDVSSWLQVLFIMLGGGYTLAKGYFIRIDILYNNYSDRGKAVLDLFFTTLLCFLFIFVIVNPTLTSFRTQPQ